jgi:hypothetical protein
MLDSAMKYTYDPFNNNNNKKKKKKNTRPSITTKCSVVASKC